ncbi:MAG: carboxymuconolactone decarboxylase family protein [Terriglobales bacterium]
MARRLGWSQQILDALPGWPAAGLELDAPTQAALRFAEAMTRDSRHVAADLFAALRRHFDEGQVVEIAAVIGLFNYFNRFNNALEMEPTRPGDR